MVQLNSGSGIEQPKYYRLEWHRPADVHRLCGATKNQQGDV